MIKMLVMDVDGTLTDGKIYISNTGEAMKAFNAHDAVGVRKLKKYDIIPVIITGRESEIVSIRAKEMNMDLNYVFQNVNNKVMKLKEVAETNGISLKDVAYIGDDENDLECFKICGFTGCPNDAMEIIKKRSDYISKYKSSEGAVRDIIEYIIKHK
ncbi:MAG: HAD-IIIA family hydrolase [Bacilli bacterium]|nr:HAD-IIIA family hydrolase [Bacilli bacterium]